MFILYSEDELKAVVRQVFDVMPGKPVLIDKFLEDAIELDVDCISDGETSVIGGMLEHIEYAGVHSGDAAMVMPPHTLSADMLATVRKATGPSFALASIKGSARGSRTSTSAVIAAACQAGSRPAASAMSAALIPGSRSSRNSERASSRNAGSGDRRRFRQAGTTSPSVVSTAPRWAATRQTPATSAKRTRS